MEWRHQAKKVRVDWIDMVWNRKALFWVFKVIQGHLRSFEVNLMTLKNLSFRIPTIATTIIGNAIETAFIDLITYKIAKQANWITVIRYLYCRFSENDFCSKKYRFLWRDELSRVLHDEDKYNLVETSEAWKIIEFYQKIDFLSVNFIKFRWQLIPRKICNSPKIFELS